jgi:hypothetical protein
MSEKRQAETSGHPPRPKRSRFGPIESTQVNAIPTASTSIPVKAINGSKAANTLPNSKALELLAKKDALKAQIQALKVPASVAVFDR